MNITLRFLEEDEYGKLEEVFKAYNDKLPLPSLSRIVIAEDENGNIIAFTSFVLNPMITMFISEEFRGNGLWKEMVDMILPLTEKTRTYVVATTDETVQMCLKMGLRVIDSPVFAKD